MALIRELCRVTKGMDEKTDESILWRFDLTERVYLGRECMGSNLVGRKQWTDSVKYYLKKRGSVVGQARRMVYDRTEWRGFVKTNAWGVAGDANLDFEPDAIVVGFTAIGNPCGVKIFLWPTLQLKGQKMEIFFSLVTLLLIYFTSFRGMICADHMVAGSVT